MPAQPTKLLLIRPEGAPPERLDKLLVAELQQQNLPISRARLKRLFAEQKIMLNGRTAPPSHELGHGPFEVLIHADLALHSRAPQAQASERGSFLPVLFEDEDLLILHKSSGIPSVPLEESETETAVGAALARCPEIHSVGFGGLEPGILHRLDTGTSGVLLFAKNQAEFDRLRGAWKTTAVRKFYRALCQSDSPLPIVPAELTPWLAHDAHSSKRMKEFTPGKTPESWIRGKPLPTHTELRELVAQSALPEGILIDLEVEILTGVMHQIRCTLASIGWPLLGDSIYGGAPSERLWLHAERLEIPLKTGLKLCIHAALPANWLIAPIRRK
jgi:23S rRNA pseudouridine1911/1915/1917 synthase